MQTLDDVAPSPASQPARTGRTAAARVLSEVFQPPFTTAALLALSPAGSPGWPGTWWYGLVAVAFTCVLPFGILLALVRAGRVVDHHVSERSQRAPVLAMALVCVLVGLGTLALAGAPASTLAMTTATVAGIALLAIVSLWWKLSGHASAVAAAALGTVLLLGPAWWPVLVVVPAVGWARVMLGAHTVGQVLAGFVVGPAVIVGLWWALLSLAGQ
ncbi:phosphatase PAP2 family protein [Sinomonas halotolerans]|uniref:Phosphatase PAP2 family protein n=1 Tax=Sinomonas halotolerans TaxID=1644133 RepID=A0ABU9WZI4_9MICC